MGRTDIIRSDCSLLYHIRPQATEINGSRPLSDIQAVDRRTSTVVGDQTRILAVVCFWVFSVVLLFFAWGVVGGPMGGNVVLCLNLGADTEGEVEVEH